MQRSFLMGIPTRALIVAIALGTASAACGAIFVSDISATASVGSVAIGYRLNEAASSGQIAIAAAATPSVPVQTDPLSAAQLSRGFHSVSVPTNGQASGLYIATIRVNATRHPAYDVIGPVTPIAANATVAYGLRVNRMAGTLGYGHIYMADFQGTMPGAHPVHEFASDGTLLQDILADHSAAFTSVGLAIGADGSLYVSDQDTDSIRHYAASGAASLPTWTIDRVYTGPVLDNTVTPPIGSLATRGFQVFGSGDAATLYTTDYSLYPNQVESAIIGDALDPTTYLVPGTSLVGRVDQILVAPNQTSIYIGSGLLPGVGRHLNRWVYGVNPATTNTEWYLDPNFAENAVATATLTGNLRGIAFAPSGDLLWVTQNGGANSPGSQNYIARVTLTPLAGSISRARDVLSYVGGLRTPTASQVHGLDTNGDGRLTLVDAIAVLQTTSTPGSVIERVSMPVGAPHPVTLDVDPKGNLVIGAKSDPVADGTTANVFFVLAPPDTGSQDTATSAAFYVG